MITPNFSYLVQICIINAFLHICYEILTKVIITCHLIYISISIDHKKKEFIPISNCVQEKTTREGKETRETEIWNKVKISYFGYTDQIRIWDTDQTEDLSTS